MFIDDINIIGSNGLNEVNESNINLTLFPNPSQESSFLSFYLSSKSTISIRLTDVIGREVENMELGVLASGNHQIEINRNRKYIPGVYFVKVDVKGQKFIKKLVIN